MTNTEVRRLGNKILAMSIATILALYAIGVATPVLTPVPVYAINYENNDKHYDDKDNKHYDNNDNYYSQFLMDVEQCFIDNGNQDEQFSYEVEQCIYDVMAAYFDDDNNNNNNGDTSCDPSYPDVCIATPPPDLNCDDEGVPENFEVVGSDPHGFDADNDGIGCETDNNNDNNCDSSTSSSTTTANGNSNNDLNDNNGDLDLNQDPGDLDDNNSERMLPQM